jgi:hypothetical protein
VTRCAADRFGRDAAIQSFDELPTFVWETLAGDAVLGLKFIDAIRPRAWPEVAGRLAQFLAAASRSPSLAWGLERAGTS